MSDQGIAMRELTLLTVRIALFYVVGAQLGYMLALLPNSTITLFWPPSGIALAAMLLRGPAALPGIFIGAVTGVVLLLPGHPQWPGVVAGVIVAVAQTLGAVAAATLLSRVVSSAPIWASARELFLGSVCMGLGCILSTSFSIGSLAALGLLDLEYGKESYGMWWLGEFCGMVIFTPAAFVVGDRISRRVRDLSKPGTIPGPTFAYSAFAAASLVVFGALWVTEDNRTSQTLLREAALAARSLTAALQLAGRDLDSIRALMVAHDHISKDEFLRHADAQFGHQIDYPGAQALGWASKVADPGAWESEMFARGEVGLRVFEVDSDGNRVPVKKRADYFPLEYVYPLDEVNRKAIGYDLGSERQRRQAVERARDTGDLSMAAPVYLVQTQDRVPALLLCWPVYRAGAGLETVAMRREALTGVAAGTYHIGRVFDAAIAGFDADIALHLFGNSSPNEGRWYHTRPSPHESEAPPGGVATPTLVSLTAGFSGSAVMKFAGLEWLVVATPGPDLVSGNRTWMPWGALGLVLALGFGLSSIMIERISAQKRLRAEQRKTEQALKEAREANEAKSYFMAAAAHDIKQPLYALGILTDTLLMSNPPENTKPVIKSLRKSIKEMSQHFDTLMDVGRFQDGSFEVRASTFPLRELSRRIALEIGPLCREKGLRWTIDFDDVEVRSDPELLLRLIRNLLINAVRYTEQGGVSCKAKRQGNIIEFRISDTGPGLSSDQQELVFNEVVQVRPDVIHTSGLGLGLSIVNKISRALDLGMKVSTAQGQGTTFTFRIPLDQP